MRFFLGALVLGLVGAGQYVFFFHKAKWPWGIGLTVLGLVALLLIPWRRRREPEESPVGRGSSRYGGTVSIDVSSRRAVGRRVMSVVALVAAALLVAVSAGAFGALIGIRVKARPTLSFKPEYDFGKVIQGRVLEKTFAFDNTGSKPLIIQQLKTS